MFFIPLVIQASVLALSGYSIESPLLSFYPEIETFLSPSSCIACYAIDTTTQKVACDQESQRQLIPASSLKIVTTAAALHLLGPEMRFETHLEYTGKIDEEGVLHGDIVIRGGGDPCLGSERVLSSLGWKKQLEAWTQAILQCGIRKIKGRVIGDSSKWEKAMAVPSWQWEDLGNAYGAGASALSFHENSYTAYFQPGKKLDDPATLLSIEPPIFNMTLQNEVITGPESSGDKVWIYGSEYSNFPAARGTVPLGINAFPIRGAIPNPPAVCANLLTQHLVQKKICVENQVLDLSSLKQTRIHTTFSPPVKEIVYWTNQKSINLYAEHLLKKMGEVVYGEGSTASGVRAVQGFLKEQGLDVKGFYMADGSGLSRKNRISAKQLTSLLCKMKESPLFPLFLRSLPQKEGGGLAKTGSMFQVRALAGFHQDMAFAVLVNE